MTQDSDKNVFDISDKRNEKEIAQCHKLSEKFSALVGDSVDSGMEPKFIAGVLADTLGRLLSRFSKKEELWKVLLKRIEKVSDVNRDRL